MNTEDLIRDALRRQADLAPPPGPVLAALHRPRRKPLFLVVATAVTAAVVAIAATALPRPSADVSVGRVDRITPPGANARTWVGLEYQPTWLPDGFTERWRSYIGGSWTRNWQRGSDGAASLRFSVTKSDLDALDASTTRTTVNGAPGYYSHNGLHWQVKPDRMLSVWLGDGADSRETLRRVAESVRPDLTLVVVPVSFKGSTDFSIDAVSPDDWTAMVEVPSGDAQYLIRLHSVDRAGGAPRAVTALGREAAYWEERGGVLTIMLAAGRYLSVGGGKLSQVASVEELVEAAGLVKFEQYPDLGWIGR
ncbi:hypothetical protein ACQPZF_37130 [Actinosynnema sp. CS-041913]|uniref:hypothetical protein n=1 Tax=Actinosynnema sp. CS-041913 TaxID=3239917 RepID=UPI003D930C9D